MSSPVVNKDTLYYYISTEKDHIIGFKYERIDREDRGWSMYLRSGGCWEWGQKRLTTEFHPVGQRCILQW